MARPSLEIDEAKLLELHSVGYPDSEIAERLGASRSTIVRRRKSLGLGANRRVGERGIAFREEESYLNFALRAMKNVGKYIGEEASEYFKRTGDEIRYQLSGVVEPKPMTQLLPGEYYQDPDKMYHKHAKYITDTEKSMDMIGISGVPGPALIELVKIAKSGNMAEIKRLVKEAVETSGFISATATVNVVKANGCTPPEEQLAHWEENEKKAKDWVPNQEWAPIKKLRGFSNRESSSRPRNGKRGRGGGIINIATHTAYQAAMGY